MVVFITKLTLGACFVVSISLDLEILQWNIRFIKNVLGISSSFPWQFFLTLSIFNFFHLAPYNAQWNFIDRFCMYYIPSHYFLFFYSIFSIFALFSLFTRLSNLSRDLCHKVSCDKSSYRVQSSNIISYSEEAWTFMQPNSFSFGAQLTYFEWKFHESGVDFRKGSMAEISDCFHHDQWFINAIITIK